MTAIQFQTVTLDVQNQSRQVERAILTLAIDASAGGNAADYLQLSSTPGSFPANLTSVAFASVVEEYQLFIREDFAIPGDATSPPTPKLARARMLPGTDALHPDGAIDIADNVFDLQVALGVDLDGNGRVDVEDAGGQALATNADEWLWNDATDDDLDWRGTPRRSSTSDSPSWARPRPPIDSTSRRLSPTSRTATTTSRRRRAAPRVAARRYRRRVLQSIVDLRNL